MFSQTSCHMLHETTQSIVSARTGGFDVWRTPEVKALPGLFAHKFTSLMLAIEGGDAWPTSLFEVALLFPPQSRTHSPGWATAHGHVHHMAGCLEDIQAFGTQ